MEYRDLSISNVMKLSCSSGILRYMPKTQPNVTPPTDKEKSNPLGAFGKMMPIIMLVVGLFTVIPNILGGLSNGLGGLMQGLMGMLQNKPTPPPADTNQAPTQNEAQNQSSTQRSNGGLPEGYSLSNASYSPSGTRAVSQAVVQVQDISNVKASNEKGSKITNDPSKAFTAIVAPDGTYLGGNASFRLADLASTAKPIGLMVASQWEKKGLLDKGFLEAFNNDPANAVKTKGGVKPKPPLQALAENSSNAAADKLVTAMAARMTGGDKDKVIDLANKTLKDDMGFKKTTLGNFSGLPTGNSGYIHKSTKNVSTAYEMAIAAQMLDSQHPEVAKYFDTTKNQTGMAQYTNFDVVKTGTARGIIEKTSGTVKSALASNEHGSIAVAEAQGVSNWHAAIKASGDALENSSINNTMVASAGATNKTPANTPSTAPNQASQAQLS